jgi:hypothetical protein
MLRSKRKPRPVAVCPFNSIQAGIRKVIVSKKLNRGTKAFKLVSNKHYLLLYRIYSEEKESYLSA